MGDELSLRLPRDIQLKMLSEHLDRKLRRQVYAWKAPLGIFGGFAAMLEVVSDVCIIYYYRINCFSHQLHCTQIFCQWGPKEERNTI